MNLFDSATPEMKRMRNQRKDGSILEQMITTSTVVEPLEFVYNADGALRNTRDIFGPLSIENSPVSEDLPGP
jgi:geranylgeranyl transferase type-2 subunit beta